MMNQFRSQQVFSLSVIRLVGYGLFLMAVIDFVSLTIPPQLMNPAWELQTTGALVERIPVTLLGIALIYYGERNDRTPIEQLLLKWLSWLCLILAIAFFLLIPLNISNSIRVYHGQNAKVNLQIAQKIDPINEFKQQLRSAKSPEQIKNILQIKASTKINIPDSVDTKSLKKNLLDNITKQENFLRSQAKNTRSKRANKLIKNCLKWNLGMLISACIFLFIWKNTLWARIEYNLD
ncbi:MAG: HpsJ family protein [Xenococcaceae cyanobacterium MO_188.B32]|nr:HpsJ family protein [Xenococcaceae cyanobacterium MO_188.B32]